MNLKDLYSFVKKQFQGSDIETPDLDARLLIQNACNIAHEDIITNPGLIISADAQLNIENMVRRRLSGEPVSKILGFKEFYGLDFKVTQDTLDPRPDTEILIESALHWARDKQNLKILDLGTGSGCIAITLLKNIATARATAIEISHKALEIARYNAEEHGVQDRLKLIQSNWFEKCPAEKFDLIVSNPPYIPNPEIENLAKEVQNYDPIQALDGGNDGLEAYKILFKGLKKMLDEDGRAFFEIGFGQHSDIIRLVDESNLQHCDSYSDLAGIPRVVEISVGKT